MEGPVVFKPHKEPHYSNGLMRRQPGLVPLKGPGGWKGESESNELGESQCIQRSNRYSQKKVKSRWFGTWQMVKEQDCKRERGRVCKKYLLALFFCFNVLRNHYYQCSFSWKPVSAFRKRMNECISVPQISPSHLHSK